MTATTRVTLPASGISTTEEIARRWKATTYRQMTTSNGLAFIAEVALDGEPAGTLENEGNGGGTWLRPLDRDARETFEQHAIEHAALEDGRWGESLAEDLVAEIDLRKRLDGARTRLPCLLPGDGAPGVTGQWRMWNHTREALSLAHPGAHFWDKASGQWERA